MNFNNVTTLIKREYYEFDSSVKWLTIFSIIILSFLFFFTAIVSLRIIDLLHETVSTGYEIKLIPSEIRILTAFIYGISSSFAIYSPIGMFIACFSFWELKQPAETRHYLLLPASAAEKALSKIAFYSIGWLLLFIITWIIAASIVALVTMVIRGTYYNIWYMLFAGLWALKSLALRLFCSQALCIFASLYFRKLVLLKLAIFYVLILLTLKWNIKFQLTTILQILSEHNINITFYKSDGLSISMEICITIALYLLIWLRLRETEAR